MAVDAQKPPWLIASLLIISAEFASDNFLKKASAVGDLSLVSSCLHPGAISASPRQDVWFRSRSPPVHVVGEREKSTGSERQREPRIRGKALAQLRMLRGHPVPFPPRFTSADKAKPPQSTVGAWGTHCSPLPSLCQGFSRGPRQRAPLGSEAPRVGSAPGKPS